MCWWQVRSNAELCVKEENDKMALAGEEGEELDVEGIELCAKVPLFDH